MNKPLKILKSATFTAMAVTPHVVWVCQWYPHEGEPYAGDFIQRHAKAASLFLPIHTYSCFGGKKDHSSTVNSGSLRETISYFKPIKTGIRPVDKILYWWKWYRLLKKQIREHIKTFGKPDLLHCHITLNTGWLGLWAKRKFGIPYVVSEHWSGYMPGAVNGFEAYNPWSKKRFAAIIRGASKVTTVSNALMQAMQKIENRNNYLRLPNVVDERIFHLTTLSPVDRLFRVLHISTFSPQKNAERMMTAFLAFAEKSSSVEFHIVGPVEHFKKHFPDLVVHPAFILHSEMPQTAIAGLMQLCDVCVLYSLYETFGCVIIEANATGKPVIVSDIPVLQEIVVDGKNGLLVSPDQPQKLTDALIAIQSKKTIFDSEEIARQAIENFSYERVGKQLSDLYFSVVPHAKNLSSPLLSTNRLKR